MSEEGSVGGGVRCGLAQRAVGRMCQGTRVPCSWGFLIRRTCSVYTRNCKSGKQGSRGPASGAKSEFSQNGSVPRDEVIHFSLSK